MSDGALPRTTPEPTNADVRENGSYPLSRYSVSLTVSVILLAMLAAFLLVPWWPGMPVAGVDPSWAYALNEAVARHLVFGRDFIWTFGPFGAVLTSLYNPATDALMLAGSALLAAALCAGFAILAWPKRAYLLLLLPIVVAEATGRDVVLMALPFLLLLITFRLSSAPDGWLHLPLGGAIVLCISTLSCAVGILPLVKGTLSALAVVNGGLAVLTAVVGGQTMLALGIASLAIASLCIGWVAAGQPLAALPHFFWTLKPIIAGYSKAMSVHGPSGQALCWTITAATITAILYASLARRHEPAGWLVLLGFAFYSFVTFKEGFVRQDMHVLIPAESFLFIGLFLSALLNLPPAVAVAVIACLGWVAIEASATNFSAATVLARIENNARRAVDGIIMRVRFPDAQPAIFARANAAIRAASPLPPVKGTVDLYPYDLALLFAAGMKWDGRPIIQSYSAYTPALEEANAKHLIGNDAPANIFFAVEPIDGRFPALEDAASWPLLLSRYSIVGLHGNYLQLVRKALPTPMRFDTRSLKVITKVNKWIDVPSSSSLLWAKIGMRPTLLGKLMLAVFKLPQVQIDLRLADGRTVRHRYIPEMGQAGFLLSPYVGSTSDFAMMAAGLDKGRDVRQIKLDAPKRSLWARRIALSFRHLHMLPQPEVRRLLLIEPTSPPAFVSARKANQMADCSLDSIDGQLFGSLSEPIVVDGEWVNVSGWTAPSAQRGIGPDETWISLTAANGERRFYQAKAVARPDVLAYFKQPRMKDPGFSADLDLLRLSGAQQLAIYSVHDNKAFRCTQRAVLKLYMDNPHPVRSTGK